MLVDVVTKLKTLSVANVVPFGTAVMPQPPYTVVKPEKDILDRGRCLRVIGHFTPDQQLTLTDYIMQEVRVALDKYSGTTRKGNSFKLFVTEYTEITITNDDGTISMDILFLAPAPKL